MVGILIFYGRLKVKTNSNQKLDLQTMKRCTFTIHCCFLVSNNEGKKSPFFIKPPVRQNRHECLKTCKSKYKVFIKTAATKCQQTAKKNFFPVQASLQDRLTPHLPRDCATQIREYGYVSLIPILNIIEYVCNGYVHSTAQLYN